MPTIEDLLLEKRRYGLPETVSDEEKKLLENDTPVQKIIGYVDLANVRIFLDKKVLIPRYETEELVLKAIKEIPLNSKVLDLGCGSGFIAVALKKNRPDLDVYASDIDEEAIYQTIQNAFVNGVKIKVIPSNVFSNLKDVVAQKKFDCIVSNPPYLSELEQVPASVIKHEPNHALFSRDAGMIIYKAIIENRRDFIEPNGILFFEINPLHTQYWEILSGAFDIEISKDMSGKNRFVRVKLDD